MDVLLLATPTELKLYMKNPNNKYDLLTKYPVVSSFPTVDIIRKTLKSFMLTVSDQESFRVSVQDNLNRDVAALVIRSFCSRKLVKEEKSAATVKPAEAQETE